jgi:serine/threonine-protein kinase
MEEYQPKQLGRYILFQRLARGGMAELHLASMSGADGFARVVVVKRMLPQFAEDPEFVRMLLNEAKLVAQLHHPNIVQVLDLAHEGDEHFIVMEFIHGADLRTLLRESARSRTLPLPCAIEIVLGVAAGLHHAHEARDASGKPLAIVHRDISPSNVLVGHDGNVKVVDFGIAKALAHTRMTSTGTIKGKMGYMAPEQCRGDAVDRRADVFALGVLLYEATLRRRMFVGDNQFAIMNAVLRADYVAPREIDPDYPAELERIIGRALQPDAQDRYSTAAALAGELEAAAIAIGAPPSIGALRHHMTAVFGEQAWPTVPTEVLGGQPTGSLLSRAGRRLGRNRWAVAAAAVGGIAIGVAGTASLEADEAEPAAVEPSQPSAELESPATADADEPIIFVPEEEPDSAGIEAREETRRSRRGRGGSAKAKKKRSPDKPRTVDDVLPPGLGG